jgi:hypothetical protein
MAASHLKPIVPDVHPIETACDWMEDWIEHGYLVLTTGRAYFYDRSARGHLQSFRTIGEER